jgi:hypothetical protein
MFETTKANGAEVSASVSVRPVSGRYEGEMTLPQPGRYVLDLRVDVDSATDNSPVLNRVSGDVFQISRTILPGQPPRVARVYIESWIVDAPQVSRFTDHVDISGDVRFWTGSHAPATIAVQIGLDAQQQSLVASVTLMESGRQRRFICHRVTDCFRSLQLEIDVCSSVNRDPIIPRYDTSWHNDRPIDLPQRALTIEAAYRETGVDVTIDRSPELVDDSADPSHSWTPAELHDAMETHFTRYAGTWPNWAMWGLMAGQFETPSVGGIMFDAAAELGGAGRAPDRQGFAVFRNHSWFDHLVPSDPQNQMKLGQFGIFSTPGCTSPVTPSISSTRGTRVAPTRCHG